MREARRASVIATQLLAALLWILALASLSFSAKAQERATLRPGDAIVTGFSGTVRPGDTLPGNVHPLDRTMINLDGPSARVLDLSALGAGAMGQVAEAPAKLTIRAGDIGQVFAAALDSEDTSRAPNAFLGATSMYGLQIVAPGDGGEPRRLLQGEAEASWMPGQFGTDRGAGPGSIWKVDGTSGAISLFANVMHDGKPNSGPGLGAIAIDQRTRQLYVSDLETGLIHRFSPEGRDLGTFDHGTIGRRAAGLDEVPYDPARRREISSPEFNIEDPSTWGYADKQRQVFGLAVQGNVLFYAVSDGPQIWSVGLNDDGSFADDPRLEIDIADTPNSNAIASIAFDGPDYVYLTQRGAQVGSYDYSVFAAPQESVVLRFSWNKDEKRWEEVADEFAIGLKSGHRATEGGIALGYGYDRNGNLDTGKCRQTLWTTGGQLRAGEDFQRVSTGGSSTINGVQGNLKTKVRPANEPPYESWFLDYDDYVDDPDTEGHMGAIAIYAPCSATSVLESAEVLEETVVAEAPNLVIDKDCHPGAIGGRIRCTVTVRNNGPASPSQPVTFLDVASDLAGPKGGGVMEISDVAPDGPEWSCTPLPAPKLSCTLAPEALPPGDSRSVDVWVDTSGIILTGDHGFRNCATMKHPDGYGKACDEGGTDIVIDKTAPSKCLPGEECEFTITITNRSELPFSGDLLLADTMFVSGASVAAPIVEISPPLGCAPDPLAVPFSCVAETTLEPGEERAHTITLSMPEPGDYWVQNCFAATDPWLVEKPDLVQDLMLPAKADGPAAPGAPACAWVNVTDKKIAAAKKGSSTPPPLTSPLLGPIVYYPDPEYPYCADGRPRLPSGRCPCPLGRVWEPETGWCEPVRPHCWDPDRRMPSGRCCPRGTEWDRYSYSCRIPRPVCFDAARRRPDGDCCPRGSYWNWASRRCTATEPVCFDGRPRLANGLCRCPFGTRWNPWTRSCERPGHCPGGGERLKNGACPCPQNAAWNPKFQRCDIGWGGACKDPKRVIPGGNCCPPRMFWNGRTCQLPGAQECPKGTVGRYPNCRPVLSPCPEGTFGKYPNCRPIVKPCLPGTIGRFPKCIPVKRPCPTGTVGTYPNCKVVAPKCPPGTTGAYPRCQKPGRPCPSGTVGVFPKCRPIVAACPSGTIGKPPNCKPIKQTCPPGTQGRYPNCVGAGPKCPPGTAGRYPKCTEIVKPCPPGTTGKFPACKPIAQKCPAGTTGTPPNCKAPPEKACPPGMLGTPPACKPAPIKRCPQGQIGTPPNCKPVPPRSCPPGFVGSPPNCAKPPVKQPPPVIKTPPPAAPTPRPVAPKAPPKAFVPKAPPKAVAPKVVPPKPPPKVLTPKVRPKPVAPKAPPKLFAPKAQPKPAAKACPPGTVGIPPSCAPLKK